MRLFLVLAGTLLAALAARSTARIPEPNPSFRGHQLQFPRVRTAYAAHEAAVQALLRRHGLAPDRLELFIRAFKIGRRVEAWPPTGWSCLSGPLK